MIFKINKDKYNIIHIHTPNVAFIVSPIAKNMELKLLLVILMLLSILISGVLKLETLFY